MLDATSLSCLYVMSADCGEAPAILLCDNSAARAPAPNGGAVLGAAHGAKRMFKSPIGMANASIATGSPQPVTRCFLSAQAPRAGMQLTSPMGACHAPSCRDQRL